MLESIRSLGDVPGHAFHGNQWTSGASELGASLKSSVNYSKGVFYSNRATMEEVLAKVREHRPDAMLEQTKRGFYFVKAGSLAFGPEGFKTLEAVHMARLLLIAAREAGTLRGITAPRIEGRLHKTADAHVPKLSVALRYAFAMGRKALKPDPVKNVEAAVKAVADALSEVLPSTLVRIAASGGEVAVRALKTLGDVEGHPFHGNQWTEGHGGGEKGLNKIAGKERFYKVNQPNKLFDHLTHDEREEYLKDFRRMPEAYKERETRESDITHLAASQESIDTKQVKELVRDPSLADDAEDGPPLVVTWRGREVVGDGHHRIAAALLRGETKMRVEHVDLTTFIKKHPRGLEAFRAAKRPATPKKIVGPLRMRFDKTNQRVIDWADRHAAELITQISETTRENINNAVAEALEQGSIKDLYDEILDAVGDETRADLIARTECLVGETLVEAAVVGAVYRRWYEGEVVDVITCDGRKFSATPNHPVLTKRGWLAAHELNESDYLVCDLGNQDFCPPRNPDVVTRPATIAEVFDTSSAVGILERQCGTDPDFHGDGNEGEVDIARPFWSLSVGHFFPIYEPLINLFLTEANRTNTPTCSLCRRLLSVHQPVCFCHRPKNDVVLSQNTADDLIVNVERSCEAFDSFVSRVALQDVVDGQVLSSVGRNATALEKECAGIGERTGYTSPSNNVLNPRLVGLHRAGDVRAAQPGQIKLDRVVSVSLRPFSGHVFNLSTPYGYFTINQGIYTGNCMTAANEGQREGWRQAVDEGLLPETATIAWIATGDAGVCPICENLDGQTRTMDGEYPDDGGEGPPAHPRCRCTEGIVG